MDNIFILPDSGYTFICSTIFLRRFVGHSTGVKRKRVPVVTMVPVAGYCSLSLTCVNSVFPEPTYERQQ